MQLFACATNVKTGKIRVFDCSEISAKAIMASACLPFLYQAVEIDGEHYWDGGFMGNPPLFPLIYQTDCEDVLIVQINPIAVDEVPTTAPAIVDRMNELSFNSSLMREMRAIAFVKKLLDEERVPRGRYKDLKIHTVEAEAEMRQLGYSSKLNADASSCDWLFELGRDAGRRVPRRALRQDRRRELDRHRGEVPVSRVGQPAGRGAPATGASRRWSRKNWSRGRVVGDGDGDGDRLARRHQPVGRRRPRPGARRSCRRSA